jgi:hypothetical protein
MAARLFISHSFADGRRAAECLVTGLTDRSRACAVWSPTRGIRSGHSWIQQVTQAFQGSAPASW